MDIFLHFNAMDFNESSLLNMAEIEKPYIENVTMGYMWSFFGVYMSRSRRDDRGGLGARRAHIATGANETTL
jgi:hypothetical protein